MSKVLFIGAYDIGARVPLVRALRSRGIEVQLAGIGATPASGEIVTHAIGSGNVKRDAAKLPAMIRSLRTSTGAQLVHAWDSLPGALAMQAARGDSATPYTRTITGTGQSFSTAGGMGFALRSSYGAAQRAVARAGAFTVFQNTDDHRLFLGKRWIEPSKALVIPGSGVDLATFDTARRGDRGVETRELYGVGDRWLVVLASRLLKAKGIDEFATAARLCDGRLGRQAVFLVVGPEEPNPRRGTTVTPFRGTEVELIYGGNCPDMPGLLAGADAMALPSAYREGIPRVLLEAAAAEVPIVASDMPGCRDVVTDGVTGLLVPARAAQPLAGAIVRLATDPLAAKRFASAARDRVESAMTLDIVADQYAELFHRLIAASSRRPAVASAASAPVLAPAPAPLKESLR